MHKINSNFSSLADALAAIIKEAQTLDKQKQVSATFYQQAHKAKHLLNRAGGNWFMCRFYIGATLFELTIEDAILIADYLTAYLRLYGQALTADFISKFSLNLKVKTDAN